MRAWQLFGVVVVACAVSVPSFAGKNKGEPTTEAGAADSAKTAEEMVMKPTGVPDVDAVFTKADVPLQTLRTVRGHLTEMRVQVTTALGLADGTPLKDALADLDQKAGDTIMLALDTGGLPQLKASDAVPANIQSAVDAVNAGMTEIHASGHALTEAPAQLQEVAVAASSINSDSVTKSGLSATAIPKAVKAVDHNKKVLSSAVDEAKAMTTELDELRSAVQALFKSA